MYQNFIIPYLCEAQHVSGDTPTSGTLCLTMSTNYTSNNFPRMKNQGLPVQFWAPGDGRCVAQNMLSFI